MTIDLMKTVIGIEFGSTRIKAVLIDDKHMPIASGEHDWENHFENGVWTYPISEVWEGLQDCYAGLASDVKEKFGVELDRVGAIGFSAMMHGYLPFDGDGKLLTPFRTWRNTITGEASEKLTELFGFNIPQRWSIAHLYQAILNGEEHVKNIKYLTTLAGYVHWQLTGEKSMGIGEASGMFPIDSENLCYDKTMMAKFDELIKPCGFGWTLESILPEIKMAGDMAGRLTEAGAKLLDKSGKLQAGIPVAPCEGDAGTGMTATNAVAAKTGNVSAGTSIFSMVVLEKMLSKVYPEIDMVTTPTGKPVAMVHCNNCTSDMNAWVDVFRETANLYGAKMTTTELYRELYRKSLEGDPDCGGVVVCNYISGEPVTGFTAGVPFVLRDGESKFTLANFLRAQLYSTLATLAIGMDILAGEKVAIDSLMGHGGVFKHLGVGQKYLAAATNAPITTMETAGEGGPYGMALLGAYMLNKEKGETLEQYLAGKVFNTAKATTLAPVAEDVKGFAAYIEKFRKAMAVEKAAVESL